jgi:hypothetical protein
MDELAKNFPTTFHHESGGAMSKIVCTLIALGVLVLTGVMIWAITVDAETKEVNDQCVRRGYVKSMELWGLDWCIKMENGGLVGVQVEGESK